MTDHPAFRVHSGKSAAEYLADAGVVTCEQDWRDHNAESEMTCGSRRVSRDMFEAMVSEGIAIQYCMPLPSNHMANAVGLWPWTDLFFRDELSDLILSPSSAGPVGAEDALGGTNGRNWAARSAGMGRS